MALVFRVVTIHRYIVRSYSRLSDTGVSNRVLKNRDSEGLLQEISLKQITRYIYSI